jgi:transposase
VALEALKGIKTLQQIAKEFDIHPAQVADWKKTLQERLSNVFEGGAAGNGTDDFDAERAALHSKIGELTVKLDFVTKKSKQLGL